MPACSDSLTLRDARRAYFDANAFGDDGGYAKRWVKLKLGPLALWLPNSEARVKAGDLFEKGREYLEEQSNRLVSAFEAGRAAMRDEMTQGRPGA